MVYRLTKQAAADVRAIYRESSGLFGNDQANRYHSNLHTVFEMLDKNPAMARLRYEIDPAVRIHPCGSHLIVYHEGDGGGIVVIRVRHHRENWLT